MNTVYLVTREDYDAILSGLRHAEKEADQLSNLPNRSIRRSNLTYELRKSLAETRSALEKARG